MNFFYTLVGDALLFSALSWFAGYGALGPATGLRLDVRAKLRLYAEVFAITIALLYLFINADQLLGWAAQPPWPGTPSPHRLVAIAIILSVGFLYTRRRAMALRQRTQKVQAADSPDDPEPPP